MAASNQTASALPQGFSVFQPGLGAPLQFLPAIGTRELDELINAYITGPASTQDKRASVSLDFLEFAHLTGQTFKFYPVYSMAASSVSPATTSPLQDSGYGSSFNTSPVMSNWDWSQVSDSSAASKRSPVVSQKGRQSPKVPVSRHTTTDFSHLPGMKILTKDGMDVTNSASRGSKTKEQRDHAHLMRIIKACDSCRRKKIRCDPSHKKRGVSTSQTQPLTKVVKKTKPVALKAHAAIPPSIQDETNTSLASFFSTTEWDSLLASAPSVSEPWDEFIDYAPAEDYDFFNDPEGYLSPVSSSSSSSQSAYSTKPVSPVSQEGAAKQYENGSLHNTDVLNDYVDFNLFSPSSTFSEDDRMVPIEFSNQSSCLSRRPPPPPPSLPIPPSELSDEASGHGGTWYGNLDGQLSSAQSSPHHDSYAVESQIYGTYRDPDPAMDVDVFTSPGAYALIASDDGRIPQPTTALEAAVLHDASDMQSYLERNVIPSHNITVSDVDLIDTDTVFAGNAERRKCAASESTRSQVNTAAQSGVVHTSVNDRCTAHSLEAGISALMPQSPASVQEAIFDNHAILRLTNISTPLSSPASSSAQQPFALSSFLDERNGEVIANANSDLYAGSSRCDDRPDGLAEVHHLHAKPATITTAGEREATIQSDIDWVSSERTVSATGTATAANAEQQDLQNSSAAMPGEERRVLMYVLCTISSLMSSSHTHCVDAATTWLTMLIIAVALFTFTNGSNLRQSSVRPTDGQKYNTCLKGNSVFSKLRDALTGYWHGLSSVASQTTSVVRLGTGLVSQNRRLLITA